MNDRVCTECPYECCEANVCKYYTKSGITMNNGVNSMMHNLCVLDLQPVNLLWRSGGLIIVHFFNCSWYSVKGRLTMHRI